MSLEQQIGELKAAILHLTAVLQDRPVATVTTSGPAPEAISNIIATTIQSHTGTTSAPAPAAPVMPPPPSFMAAPAAPAVTVPFSDPKGLIEYVMQAYKDMGREKGAAIGDVLTKMGLKAINEVQPSQYADFFAAVEALK